MMTYLSEPPIPAQAWAAIQEAEDAAEMMSGIDACIEELAAETARRMTETLNRSIMAIDRPQQLHWFDNARDDNPIR